MNTLIFAAALALAAGPPSPAAAIPTIHVKGFAYVPAVLTVSAGTTVRFVNDDSEAHTVTADDKSFDSAGLDTGDTWTCRFAAAGKFSYFCQLHPYMRGTIVVRPTKGTAV
ncbi:MAG TPA: cupredoxin family copper-binding protein [Candidatus Tumulicola sp.]|jgi:plastocyanin